MAAGRTTNYERLRALPRRSLAHVRRHGTLALLAGLAAVATAARAGTPIGSFTFGGRIFAADGGSLDGVRVVATDMRGTYEAIVDSSGLFVGEFPDAPLGRVTIRVFADSAPRYHPSAITPGRGVLDRHTRVVIIPTRWTIRGGTFDGRDVRIDPLQATARFRDVTAFWGVTKRGRLSGRAVAWPADSFPIRVAFRRERHDPTISPDDSAQFWAMAEELERRLGRSLFRRATYEEIDAGAEGILVTVDRRMFAAGRTFITFDPTGRIYEALVTVGRREYLGDPRVTMHELLHSIGFGHTGGWPSVMGPSTSDVTTPTMEDVAYAQLYYAISRLQREHDAPYGILEAGRDVKF